MKLSRLGLVFSVAIVSAASAQDTPEHKLALVAGYKATFTCSGIFNAGATLDQIAAHELRGILPDYQESMVEMTAIEINRERHYVAVTYADNMPPRIAAWRPYLGCAQLPIGASSEAIKWLPKVAAIPADAGDRAKTPWPYGDANHDQGHESALDAIVAAAFDLRTYGEDAETSAVLVTTPDRILAEQYLPGYGVDRPQRTWSVAKSIAATVIGVAVKDGLLNVKAPSGIPEWQSPGDPRQAITLENLLHMSSGLYSGQAGNRTDLVYFGGSRVTATAVHAPLDAIPGERWRYANNDTMLAIRALRAALDQDQGYRDYPFTKLIYKLGMHRTFLETDWEGNFILSSQVWTTARDLGRLGLLYLNNGRWNGEQLLPLDWAQYVATPAPAQPPSGPGRAGYGAQFWLYDERVPNVPDDAYAALGNRGQFVVIIPSRGLVLVRRGYDNAGGGRFDMPKFIADILAALEQ